MLAKELENALELLTVVDNKKDSEQPDDQKDSELDGKKDSDANGATLKTET